MSEIRYIQGVFKEELKNRFLCFVSVANEDVLCYIPSSCRLSNFLEMSNRKVLLVPTTSPSARTKYSVYAVRVGRRYIPINLSGINSVIFCEITRRYFSFLGRRVNVLREKTIQGYKSDLFIRDTRTIVEIKCILSFDKEAVFPTVFSERANSQLRQISQLLEDGYRVCYLFVSLNPVVKQLTINSENQEYWCAFYECLKKGMRVEGVSVVFNGEKITVNSKLEVKVENEQTIYF